MPDINLTYFVGRGMFSKICLVIVVFMFKVEYVKQQDF